MSDIPSFSLVGDALTRGRQIGKQLGPEIRQLLRGTRSAALRLAGPVSLLRGVPQLFAQAPPHILAEMSSLQTELGCRSFLSRLPLMGLNVLDDLLRITRPDKMLGLACTSVVVRKPDGSLLWIRHLDYPPLDRSFAHHIHGSVVRTEFREARDIQFQFVSWGWPGYLGVVTGINDQGIAVAFHVAFTDHQSLEGMPSAFLCRTILENADSISDALSIVRSTRAASAGTILVVDFGRAEASAIEVDSESCFERKLGDDGVLVVSNNFRTLPSRNWPTTNLRYLAAWFGAKHLVATGNLSIGTLVRLFNEEGILSDWTVYRIMFDGGALFEALGRGQFYSVTLPFSVP